MSEDSDLVLALDIGTSSCRAMIFDSAGRAVEGLKEQIHYDLITDPEGKAELESDALIDRIAESIDGVLIKLGDGASRIRAVAICTFWHSVLAVNESGRAISPIYLWAVTR